MRVHDRHVSDQHTSIRTNANANSIAVPSILHLIPLSARPDSAAPDVQAATAPTTAAAPPATTAEASPEEQAGDALDFSKMISSEVKDLKDVKKQPFVVHDTGVKTCMFVGMPLAAEDKPGPCEVRFEPPPPPSSPSSPPSFTGADSRS